MSKLIVHDEHGQHSYDLHGTVSIGRHPNSLIRLSDPRVSKKHALVRRSREGYIFEDLGSSNGSFFEGVRIHRHLLKDGDMIVMGKTALTFHAEMEGADISLPHVDVSQALTDSQVHGRLEIETAEKFLPEREVSDLNVLRIDYEKLRLGQELLKEVGFARSLSAILDTVSNEMLRIFPADRCVILLASPDEGHLVPAVAKTMYGTADRVVVSESVLNEVRETRTAVLLSDANINDRFSESSSLIMQGIRSVMCAPIMHDGEFLGVLHLDSQRGASSFSQKDLQLMTSIVRYVAMSIANVRLLRKVEQEAMAKAQFERLLSPGVVEQIVAGKVKLEKGGELRDVTIMFADIRDFTQMSSQSEPTEVVAMLNSYYEMLVDIVFQYGGTVDKYIGDAIMVLFGAPITMRDAADRAVHCAIDMLAALKEFNHERASAGLQPIEAGIGISSGEVVVGSIGSSRTMQYTCIGNAVNVASRLTAHAGANQVLVSQETLGRLSGSVDYETLPPVMLKGIDGELQAYDVKELARLHPPGEEPL